VPRSAQRRVILFFWPMWASFWNHNSRGLPLAAAISGIFLKATTAAWSCALWRGRMDAIDAYDHQLLDYATHRLSEIPGLRIIGMGPDKAGVLSFTFDGFRTEDLGALLNKEGVAVRSGHHYNRFFVASALKRLCERRSRSTTLARTSTR
jgi:selenocysteine lyase/cysteine desulfurase